MNKDTISIVILAAGKGSRMKSDKAKVLHAISGKEMLYHIIKTSLALSNDVSVVVAHQKEAVIEAMQKYFTNVTFIVQDLENFPGTGGAMKNVMPKNDKVLVLNGDMPLITPKALEGFFALESDIVMSIFDLANPDGYGRVILDENQVVKSSNKKMQPKRSLLPRRSTRVCTHLKNRFWKNISPSSPTTMLKKSTTSPTLSRWRVRTTCM